MTKAELLEAITQLVDSAKFKEVPTASDIPSEAYACISFGPLSDPGIDGVLPGDIVFGWNGENPAFRIPLLGILQATLDSESTAIEEASDADLSHLRDVFIALSEYITRELEHRGPEEEAFEPLDQQDSVAKRLIEMVGAYSPRKTE